uniref:Scaffolding protein n=1 Tax=viral metagenome TaxID=1070528 RepID=A0A6M3JVS2_9ZZZZ
MESQDNVVRTQETTQVDTVQATEEGTVKTEKSYTQEEFAKMQSTFEKKARQYEREAKTAKSELDTTRGELSTLSEQVSKLTTEIERRELAGLEDLPQAQKLLALNKEVRDKESLLLRQQREFQKTQQTAMEGLKFKDALTLSKDTGIDVEELLECETYEAMLKTALQKVKEQAKTPQKLKVPEHIDSAISTASGKGRIWKASEISSMSADERFANRTEITKALTEGRIDNTR